VAVTASAHALLQVVLVQELAAHAPFPCKLSPNMVH
jgi:hypothetical protein